VGERREVVDKSQLGHGDATGVGMVFLVPMTRPSLLHRVHQLSSSAAALRVNVELLLRPKVHLLSIRFVKVSADQNFFLTCLSLVFLNLNV
jgi:hypothetical protein